MPNLNVIVLYRPPQSTGFYDQLDELLYEVSALPGEFIVCADFNCGSSTLPGTVDKQLAFILESHNLQQHIASPTRGKALLDLVITSHGSLMIQNTGVRDLGVFDHSVISAQVNVSMSQPRRRRRRTSVTVTVTALSPSRTTWRHPRRLRSAVASQLLDGC